VHAAIQRRDGRPAGIVGFHFHEPNTGAATGVEMSRHFRRLYRAMLGNDAFGNSIITANREANFFFSKPACRSSSKTSSALLRLSKTPTNVRSFPLVIKSSAEVPFFVAVSSIASAFVGHTAEMVPSHVAERGP
jgi:hypothetical protein